ncbi:MAG: hypothetical protein P4M11_03195 [Candidatus Pacebacteria bacterium]|nr:hypothetical protein [Candidatus Paceibacterota bacterium]
MSLDLLRKAETLSKNSLRLRAITCNNLACYYNRTKKARSAVNFLESALTFEYKQLKEIDDAAAFEAALLVDNPSDAHLNLCVSLSDLGRHEQALQNAMQALVFVQNEIIERQHLGGGKKEKSAKDETTHKNEPRREDGGLLKSLKDRYAVLCIAYHNVAVQHEFLKNVRCPRLNRSMMPRCRTTRRPLTRRPSIWGRHTRSRRTWETCTTRPRRRYRGRRRSWPCDAGSPQISRAATTTWIRTQHIRSR